ncbi:MAG: FecR family protein, partial [Armatimonadota bacterium]
MRKSAVLLVGVLGIFILLGVLMMQSLFIVQRIASVSEAAGEVFVKTATEDDFRPLGDTEHVLAGYMVRTGLDSGVTLNWVDGSRVRLGPETSVLVRKCSLNTNTKETTSLFDLDAGRIWVRVLSALGGKTKFEVRTPTATAGVRGTVFSVAVDEAGQTSVSVYEGEVAVETDGTTATVTPGLQAIVEGGTAQVDEQPAEALHWDGQSGIIGPRLDLDQGERATVAADAESVTISGVAEPGATVTINGSPVEIDRSSRFAAQVPVDGSTDGVIVVTATDYRGGQTVRAISLTRS